MLILAIANAKLALNICAIANDSDANPDIYFPGDDLLALCRARGLPIGNLTSQVWSNVMLDELDQFVKRDLRCVAYLRYVDDLALFSNSKRELNAWKQATIQRLTAMRMRLHAHSAHALPCQSGVPWLGFVVYPEHRLLKARVARLAEKRLKQAKRDWQFQQLSMAQWQRQINGWVAIKIWATMLCFI